MAVQPLLPQPPKEEPPAAPPKERALRVEYVGFQDVEQDREFRFRVYGRDGSGEVRVRIGRDAFDARRISMQDCPDLCYQVLLRVVGADVTALPEVITIADADLVSYRAEHTPVPRRRARPEGWEPRPAEEPKPAVEPRKPWLHRPSPRKAEAAPVVPPEVVPAFAEGRRVSHAVFGLGVTLATSSERTIVSFDQGGPRSFVTSMLELELLSAPGTWEIGRGGNNRPCRP